MTKHPSLDTGIIKQLWRTRGCLVLSQFTNRDRFFASSHTCPELWQNKRKCTSHCRQALYVHYIATTLLSIHRNHATFITSQPRYFHYIATTLLSLHCNHDTFITSQPRYFHYIATTLLSLHRNHGTFITLQPRYFHYIATTLLSLHRNHATFIT